MAPHDLAQRMIRRGHTKWSDATALDYLLEAVHAYLRAIATAKHLTQVANDIEVARMNYIKLCRDGRDHLVVLQDLAEVPTEPRAGLTPRHAKGEDSPS